MKKHNLRKGILIAIEGIDGAGKTTQTVRLRDYFRLKGFNVINFKEPTDGQYGQIIRNLAINGRHTTSPEDELELFINDRIEDCQKNILPALANKQIILMDRYYFSNVAYQGALGIDTKRILSRNEEIAVIPDLVILLDLAVKIGLSRIKNNRKESHNHFEKEEYLEKVRKIFQKLEAPYIQMINGSRDEESVFHNIKNIIQGILGPYISKDESQFDLFEASIKKGKVKLSIN